MSGHVSGPGSGGEGTVYLYSSDLPLPPAIIRSDWMNEYSAILPPEDEFQKSGTHQEKHSETPLEKIWMKLKHWFNVIWNGPNASHGGDAHH